MPGILDEVTAELEEAQASSPRKKASVLDEVIAEVEQEPKQKSVLDEVAGELDDNPASLRARKQAGETLTPDQERLVYDFERDLPVLTKVGEAATAIGPALAKTVVDLAQGAGTFVKSGIVEPVSSALIPEGDIMDPVYLEELRKEKAKRAEAGEAAWRSLGAGFVNAGEDIAGMVAKASYGGSALTDRLKEAVGAQTADESFVNAQLREDFSKAREEDQTKTNPDRMAVGLSRLADIVVPGEFGKNLSEELKGRALQNIDPQIVQVGDFLAPGIGEEQLLKLTHKPLAAVTNAAGSAILKGTTKGVAPVVEGIGKGGLWVSDKISKGGGMLSEALTGDPNTILRNVSLFNLPLRVPSAIVAGTGRTLKDLGRQIELPTKKWYDLGGEAGVEGLAQRAGKDAASGKVTKALFGPDSFGGVTRARMFDASSRWSGYYATQGINGAAVQMLLGIPDAETGRDVGAQIGSGWGIAGVSASRPGALKHEAEMQRRTAEDADIQRAKAAADPTVAANVSTAASPAFRAQMHRDEAAKIQAQIGMTFATPGMEEKRKALEALKAQQEAKAVKAETVSPADAKEAERLAWLGWMDRTQLASSMLKSDTGFGEAEVKLLTAPQISDYLDQIYAPNIRAAQADLANPASSPAVKKAAQDLLNDVASKKVAFASERGVTLTEGDFPVKGVVAIVNAEKAASRYSSSDVENVLGHELAHVIKNFREARGLLDPVSEIMFAKYVVDVNTGEKIQANDGIYTDTDADRDIEFYLSKLSPEARAMQEAGLFSDREKAREAIREERYAEAMNLSAPNGQLRRKLDSSVQSALDWAATAELNGRIGKLRDWLNSKGIILGKDGQVSSVLATGIDPVSLAAVRQFQRALRDYQGRMTRQTGNEENIRVSIPRIMQSRVLQRKYQDAGIFEMEQATEVYGPDGKLLLDVPITDKAFNQGGEYTVKGGKLFDLAGIPVVTVLPGVDFAAMPDGSRINVGSRIARNPDGTPKILSERETESRSKARGRAIQEALDNAPDDGTPNRLQDTGNGSYRGVITPAQMAAIDALPEKLVPRALKTKIRRFNEGLAKRDGTRFVVEYQAALKGGKYRALSPRIRDLIPIGFQFSKQGNFLATTVSVSRMFDKLNYMAQNMPDKLRPWGGDQAKMWGDIVAYLHNHAGGNKGETGLDIDPALAIEKKNRINDFLNMFDKDTEGANPDRTKVKAKRGQDSVDRIIMSARMDRINAMEESTAQKLPVNYELVKQNFMPDEQGFYSRLEEGLRNEKQKILSADQAKALGKKVTNEEELKWTDYEDLVDRLASEHNGKIPREKLLEALQGENGVRLEEVKFTQESKPEIRPEKEAGGEDGFALYDRGEFVEWYETRQEAENSLGNLERVQGPGSPRNTDWTLPGGENRTELILKVPQKQLPFSVRKEAGPNSKTYVVVKEDGSVRASGFPTAKAAKVWADENFSSNYPFSPSDTPHYSDLKALAWVRMNDRVDSEGQEGKFIDEIQSKLHQEGRDKGYQVQEVPFVPAEARQREDGKWGLWKENHWVSTWFGDSKEAAEQHQQEIAAIIPHPTTVKTGVPDAPFKKDWPLRMFQRALREAVNEGKSWIGWTTGETQADRYSLAKQVDVIRLYRRKNDSTFEIQGRLPGSDRMTMIKDSATAEELPGIIGKELTLKAGVEDFRPGESVVLEGADLKVGGEGMKGFYDSMLPKIVGKYVKQWGGKVEAGDLANPNGPRVEKQKNSWAVIIPGEDPELFNSAEAAKGYAQQRQPVSLPFWKVSISPEMAASVSQKGQPRFMPAQVEDFPLSAERLEELKKDQDVLWHGSVSGNLRGGLTGLHVGTYQAAKEALEAQIGIPAEGEWDGTREYSKTLLMGQNRQQEIRKNATTEKDKFFGGTGYNAMDAKPEDHYPVKELRYSNGDPVPSDAKPSITPVRITGKMSNSFWAPHGDWAANGRMRGMLKRGKARSGYYYTNESEDAGSISAVLPNGSFLAQVQFMPGEDPVVAAAVKINGKTYTGITHGDALDAADEAGESVDGDALGDDSNGFVTRSGKFLTRKEAYQHAVAQKQMKPGYVEEQLQDMGWGPEVSQGELLTDIFDDPEQFYKGEQKADGRFMPDGRSPWLDNKVLKKAKALQTENPKLEINAAMVQAMKALKWPTGGPLVLGGIGTPSNPLGGFKTKTFSGEEAVLFGESLSHANEGLDRKQFTFRYRPEQNTIWWWEHPSEEVRDETAAKLKAPASVRHKRIFGLYDKESFNPAHFMPDAEKAEEGPKPALAGLGKQAFSGSLGDRGDLRDVKMATLPGKGLQRLSGVALENRTEKPLSGAKLMPSDGELEKRMASLQETVSAGNPAKLKEAWNKATDMTPEDSSDQEPLLFMVYMSDPDMKKDSASFYAIAPNTEAVRAHPKTRALVRGSAKGLGLVIKELTE